MRLVRIGTGSDAADVSFATVFGSVALSEPVISIEAIADDERGGRLLRHRMEVLSTHGEIGFAGTEQSL